MATLADLNVEILANTSNYVSGLRDAQAKTKTFADKTGGLLKGVGVLAGGAVLLGGAAAAGVATGFIRTVHGITAFEQALRPAIERSRIAAESLQVLAEAAKRAGSEDGLEAVVDASQELQLELGLIAAEGDSRALPFLERLGLKAEELRAMEPEAAFRAVVEQLQRIPNVADRATAAEEIFGGTSEKLAGIINLTNAEFAALQTEVENTSNILSGQALDDAKAFDQEMRNLKATLQADAQAFAVDMLPAMTSVLVYMNTTAVPGIKDFKTDALEPLASFIKDDVVPAFGNFKADGLVPAAAAIQGFKTDALQPLATFFLETLVGGLKAFTDELPTIEEHLVPVVESFTGLADAVAPIVEDLAPLGPSAAVTLHTLRHTGEGDAAGPCAAP